MPAKVILRLAEGKLAEKEFVFDERTTCIVGRATDCNPKIPDDKDHNTISRHHCLLDINPPDIRVRDFGSRNGTKVNSKPIGKRKEGQTPEDGAKLDLPEYELKSGDRIGLEQTVFQVVVYIPKTCAKCDCEIPDEQLRIATVGAEVFVCESCRKKAERAGRKVAAKKRPKVCAKCRKDVADEIGENRHGDYICVSCKADPLEILKVLLHLAKSGEKDLADIKGYKLIKELGRGGMGIVYLARDERTTEDVALKLMLPEVAAEAHNRTQFLREMENTKALKHPNVVKLKNNGCSKGAFFFTMEFCNAGSVDQLMARRGGILPVNDALRITLQGLDGLSHAHTVLIPQVKRKDGTFGQGRGLVHRDISPHNIFLSDTGGACTAKIADYGLAKAFDNAGLSGMTRTGMAAGKPVFMPRQQVINYKYAKPDVDVWAMAACLYNMMTGRFPRNFPRDKDPWQTVLHTNPVPIRQRDPSIPLKLAEVIDNALDDSSKKLHFATAAELKEALRGVV